MYVLTKPGSKEPSLFKTDSELIDFAKEEVGLVYERLSLGDVEERFSGLPRNTYIDRIIEVANEGSLLNIYYRPDASGVVGNGLPLNAVNEPSAYFCKEDPSTPSLLEAAITSVTENFGGAEIINI